MVLGILMQKQTESPPPTPKMSNTIMRVYGHGLAYVMYIAPLEICSDPQPVHDKQLGSPTFVRLAYCIGYAWSSNECENEYSERHKDMHFQISSFWKFPHLISKIYLLISSQLTDMHLENGGNVRTVWCIFKYPTKSANPISKIHLVVRIYIIHWDTSWEWGKP